MNAPIASDASEHFPPGPDLLLDDVLVECISIDGMCGVYWPDCPALRFRLGSESELGATSRGRRTIMKRGASTLKRVFLELRLTSASTGNGLQCPQGWRRPFHWAFVSIA